MNLAVPNSSAGDMEGTKVSLSVETFYVIDFDRCLGRTERFQALLESVIKRRVIIDLEMIQYAHARVKQTGGSFDTATYVRRVLNERGEDGDKLWNQIESEFIKAALRQDMLEPHAEELLQLLDTRSAHYGILTFGGSDWQSAKLKAAGLSDIAHMITSHKEKGRLIASWQQPGKEFIIPADLAGGSKILTRHLVFIDDKPVSFSEIPSEVQGICVSPVVGSEAAALAANVTVVHGMAEVVQLLFGQDNAHPPNRTPHTAKIVDKT